MPHPLTKQPGDVIPSEGWNQLAGRVAYTRADMAAGDIDDPVYLSESGREGHFVFSASNQSANVTIDTAQGIYVPLSSDLTGASGAWVRKFSGNLDASWFGLAATGTGAANATALDAAIAVHLATAIPLTIRPGIYNKTGATTITGNYMHISGASWGKTVFRPTSATETFIINSRYGYFGHIGCDGVIAGTYGIVVKNANATVFDDCDCRNFDNDGMFFSPTYGGGSDGNNNSSLVRRGHYVSNDQCGIRMELHGDNNNIGFEAVDCSGNDSHGILAKGSKFYIDPGCLLEGNSGYGIQIGEDVDAATTVDGIIDMPWIEANTLGGVRGTAESGNNTIRLMNAGQTYTRHASAADTVSYVGGGGLYRFGSVDGNAFVQASATGAEAYLLSASKSGGNVNLSLGGAGTGIVWSLSDFSLASGKVFKINSVQVVGARGAAVADATDAATVITQLNALLARLRTHGLIAP